MDEALEETNTRRSDRIIRKRFTKTALWGVPWFLIMNAIVFIAAVAVWWVLQKLFHVPFFSYDSGSATPLSFYDYPRVILIMTLVGFLAYPLLLMLPSTRWAHHMLGGYGISTIKDRMHVKSTAMGWVKSAAVGIGLGILIVAMTTALSYFSGSLKSQDTPGDTTTGITAAAADAVLHGNSPYLVECILLLLCVFFIAPICEEVLFRGIIGMSMRESGLFRRTNSTIRMILICLISGLLFGILHAQFSSSVSVSLMTMFQTTVIGMIFTWVAVYKYDSLVPTMFAHMTNNILSILVLLMIGAA